MKYWSYIALVLLAACVEPDISMVQPQAENVIVELDIQRPKAFMNIIERNVSQAQDRNFWHLRFQTQKDEWGVYLNPFIDISVYNTLNTRFDADYSILVPNAKWKKDVLNQGELTSAIGVWGGFEYEDPSSYQEVYLLALARKTDTLIYKFQMLDTRDGDYRLRYSLLDGSEDHELKVHKDPSRTHNYLNLYGQGIQPEIEPARKEWQLEFTFTPDTTFSNAGPPIYTVGAEKLYPTLFLNAGVEYVVETDYGFDELDFFMAKKLPFKRRPYLLNPLIRFDPIDERYVVQPNVFLVCRWEGFYCKMQLDDVQRGTNGEFIMNLRVQNL